MWELQNLFQEFLKIYFRKNLHCARPTFLHQQGAISGGQHFEKLHFGDKIHRVRVILGFSCEASLEQGIEFLKSPAQMCTWIWGMAASHVGQGTQGKSRESTGCKTCTGGKMWYRRELKEKWIEPSSREWGWAGIAALDTLEPLFNFLLTLKEKRWLGNWVKEREQCCIPGASETPGDAFLPSKAGGAKSGWNHRNPWDWAKFQKCFLGFFYCFIFYCFCGKRWGCDNELMEEPQEQNAL